MRRYWKRFLLVIFGAFTCSFVVLNYAQLKYEHDQLGLGLREESWGMNFDLDLGHGRMSIQQPHSNKTSSVATVTDLKKLWPVLDREEKEDRIVEQLYTYLSPQVQTKTIAISGGGSAKAQERLKSEKCPVNQCTFIPTISVSHADAVIFFGSVRSMPKPPNQIWALYLLESPYHSPSLTSVQQAYINWTATYRRDSVLSTPYEKFVHFDNFTRLPDKPARNYAAGKTKMVAWFVSNCNAPNGRQKYVKELQNYISVDIYGHCGTLKCSRSNSNRCYDLLNKDYKFYLAFENSNCKDYITEKLYWNALSNDVVPVVMGAHPDDYLALAPPESYIHVDHFESPQDLAAYLHKLDQNPDLYNSYFRWKGTGHFINTKFWCRVCNMVHGADSVPGMAYRDVNRWWRGDNVCVKPKDKPYATWKGVERIQAFWRNNTMSYS